MTRRLRVALVAILAAVAVLAARPAWAATGTHLSPDDKSANPILARSLSGYSIQEGGYKLTRVSVDDHVFAHRAAQVTSTASTTRIREPRTSVKAGQLWTFASDVKASRPGATGQITVSWYTSSGLFLSWSGGSAMPLSPTNWRRLGVALVVPRSAAIAETVVNVMGSARSARVLVTLHDVRVRSKVAVHNLPAQPASVAYRSADVGGYAHPGGLVIAGRDNYQNQAFRRISAGGGSVLIYLDTLIDDDYGRYHDLLDNQSACGPAVGRWPGNYQANSWGYLNDFRPGSVLQSKLECVLETMVKENPQMAGWMADDLGSRSWFPNLNWSSFPDKQAYRDGAIEISKTFRKVADRHGLIFIVNGTWSANDGGGYPDASRSGNALADGGMVEHHDGQIGYFGPYGCSSQWAAQSAVTKGVAFNWAITSTAAGRVEYASSGCFAYVSQQTNYDDPVAAWGAFHATGLPSRVVR